MKKLTAFIALFVLIGCVFAAGCVDKEAEEGISPDPIVYTVPADGGVDRILVPAGSVIDISAPANPSTGYFWEAKIDEALHLDFERYLSSDVDDEQFGGAGSYIWTVTADEPGIYCFSAEYKRSGDADVQSRFALYVGVGDVVFEQEGGEASLSAKTRDKVTVLVPANPSTGYVWMPTAYDGLQIVNQMTVVPSLPAGYLQDPEDRILGNPGIMLWELSANKAGDYVFSADYKRAGGEPLYTLTLNIKAA